MAPLSRSPVTGDSSPRELVVVVGSATEMIALSYMEEGSLPWELLQSKSKTSSDSGEFRLSEKP